MTAPNSLPLLLVALGNWPTLGFEADGRISDLIYSGIDIREKIAPAARDQIIRIFYRNPRIAPGAIEEIDKLRRPHLIDFPFYSDYMTANDSNIHKNIRDDGRRDRLAPISTPSRGHDTGFVNAIAARRGLDAVVTISKARQAGAFAGRSFSQDRRDDGSEICAALSLPVTRLDRLSFTASFDDPYLLYAASDNSEAVSLRKARRHLRHPSVMLTGVRGYVVWVTSPYSLARPRLLKGPDRMRTGDEEHTEVAWGCCRTICGGWTHGCSGCRKAASGVCSSGRPAIPVPASSKCLLHRNGRQGTAVARWRRI